MPVEHSVPCSGEDKWYQVCRLVNIILKNILVFVNILNKNVYNNILVDTVFYKQNTVIVHARLCRVKVNKYREKTNWIRSKNKSIIGH